MKYIVTLLGETFVVDVEGEHATLGERRRDAQMEGVPRTPLKQILLDGQSRVVAVSRSEGGWIVQTAGERWDVTVEDERTRTLRELTGARHARAAGGVIRAPMPGLVLRVEVEAGQQVVAGQGVVVLEAMKMENEITAPAAGKVTKVHVAAGEAVEKGTALVEVIAEPQ